MASNVSTVDGMGFEEVNQATSTETISGTNIYGTTISGNQVRFNDVEVTDSVSAISITERNRSLYSTSYQNGSDVYGMRVRAGSVLTGDDGVGLILFADDWSEANSYFITMSPSNWTLPVVSNEAGSSMSFAVSGTRRASGCTVLGPSGTVADWIAVGI